MDPDVALEEIRQLAARGVEFQADGDEAARLSELILGLDEWLSRGGFLPDAWQRNG